MGTGSIFLRMLVKPSNRNIERRLRQSSEASRVYIFLGRGHARVVQWLRSWWVHNRRAAGREDSYVRAERFVSLEQSCKKKHSLRNPSLHAQRWNVNLIRASWLTANKVDRFEHLISAIISSPAKIGLISCSNHRSISWVRERLTAAQNTCALTTEL